MAQSGCVMAGWNSAPAHSSVNEVEWNKKKKDADGKKSRWTSSRRTGDGRKVVRNEEFNDNRRSEIAGVVVRKKRCLQNEINRGIHAEGSNSGS